MTTNTKFYNLYFVTSEGSELIEKFDSIDEAIEKTNNLGKYWSDKLDERNHNALEIINSETEQIIWISPIV